MDALITITGFHDPYFKGLVDQEEQVGPILSLLAARRFGQVFLFSMPSTEDITADTMEAIHRVHPDTSVEILEVKSDDPTDYRQVITSLRNHVRQIQDRLPGAHFSIAVASGAPHMQACWVLLAAAGEIPGHVSLTSARLASLRQSVPW